MHEKRGQPIPSTKNTNKMSFPLRGDVKLSVARIVTDLEVDNERETPFKLMRYPLVFGNKKKELQDAREKWFIRELDFSQVMADQWTTNEFKVFFGTEDEWIDKEDPGQTIEALRDFGFEEEKLVKLASDTKKFFALADSGLIRKTPMKTFQKNRYSVTTRTDLLVAKELPEKMDFWTINAGKLNNILTQALFVDYYVLSINRYNKKPHF